MRLSKSKERPLALDVAARILSLKKAEESDADFARRIGVTPQAVSGYRTGKYGASVEAVAGAAAAAGVSAEWLLTGKGDKRPIPPSRAAIALDEIRRIVEDLDEVTEVAEAARRADLAGATEVLDHHLRREAETPAPPRHRKAQ